MTTDKSTRPPRSFYAVKAWPILIARAKNHETITYGELDKIIGFGNPLGLGQYVLDYILKYCDAKKLPPLPILVVSKSTGDPSIAKHNYTPAQKKAVFEFDWHSIAQPTPVEFDAAWQNG